MILPSSTYRVQLHKDFTFRDLLGILDYLEKLGINTIYAAPILKATAGSMHGYDVTDPHVINPEIGTIEDLREIARILRTKKMTWIQDIVPNHMAFNSDNVRLMDALERGNNSPYHNYFDINWNHPDPDLNGKVMVPFLGKELKECVENGEIILSFSDQGFSLGYYDAWYPLSIDTIHHLSEGYSNIWSDKLKHQLTDYCLRSKEELNFNDWLHYKKQWITSILDSAEGQTMQRVVERINSDKNVLNQILDSQFYRLTYWKRTESVINYRRFFTVNSLICLRMELDEVFREYHTFIASLFEEDLIQGVRIDHIDGLNDPSAYLKKLRKLLGKDCYIIAEKILEAKEEIPDNWPLEGTSGYEFLSYVNQLFTDRRGTEELVSFYHKLLPGMPAYEDVVFQNKRLILNNHMAGELENLVTYFFDLDLAADFSRERVKEALSLLMLALPVYRIYPDTLPLRGMNLKLMMEGFERAIQLTNDYNPELNYLQSLCITEPQSALKRDTILLFLKRLMQFTGPLTAKGVEDTTFYVYNPLISHEEVGDAPSTLGISIQEFHKRMIRRNQSTPYSLNATATHDTKRGEDARLRLNVISEAPQHWIGKVTEWMDLNRKIKKTTKKGQAPIVNDEYFIYQSILGGFPEDMQVNSEWIGRLKEYMMKVVREAKVVSSWESPNEEYEDACKSFLEEILKDGSDFLQSFMPFLQEINSMAQIYSVAQTVIKITAPGIPDIYQGCELYDLSYVDPDNRRPVDFTKRKIFVDKMLSRDFSPEEFLKEHVNEGAMKIFATMRCLHFRREHALLFTEGAYLPLALSGHGGLAIAFARYHKDEWCIVIIPLGLGGKNNFDVSVFNDIFISLPASSPRQWRNLFSDRSMVVTEQISVAEVLEHFPVAVLSSI